MLYGTKNPHGGDVYGAELKLDFSANINPLGTPPGVVAAIADAARLLKLRGQAMQKAVPVGVGAMAALLGVGLDVAQKIAADAAQGDVCDVANDNDTTQVVLSGHKTAIDRVGEVGKAHGLRRAMPLPVSAPFHCRLMQPAADAMAEALGKVTMKAPDGTRSRPRASILTPAKSRSACTMRRT